MVSKIGQARRLYQRLVSILHSPDAVERKEEFLQVLYGLLGLAVVGDGHKNFLRWEIEANLDLLVIGESRLGSFFYQREKDELPSSLFDPDAQPWYEAEVLGYVALELIKRIVTQLVEDLPDWVHEGLSLENAAGLLRILIAPDGGEVNPAKLRERLTDYDLTDQIEEALQVVAWLRDFKERYQQDWSPGFLAAQEVLETLIEAVEGKEALEKI